MSNLSDAEKVLQYLLGQKRDGGGRFYLAMNNYSAVHALTPELFIEQLRILEHDGLIGCVFTARPSPNSTCHVTILAPALSYFEDKKTKKKESFWKPVKLTMRDIALLAIGAVLTKVADFVFAWLF